MGQLQEGTLCEITYTKSEEDVSNRVIIPSFVPNHLIRGLDVTDLTGEDRELLLSHWNEYADYKKQQLSTIFSFEQFVEQQHPLTEFDLKWRSFDVSKIS